jgi:tRNA-dependent cyclodipeptide synthase
MSIDNQIIDAIDASIYWKDLDGKYLGCNKYMVKMSGMPYEKIIGSTDLQMPWKDQAAKIREIDQLVITKSKKYEIEERPIVEGGTPKIFLSSKTPLLSDEGDVIGIIGVSIDITNYKQFEYEFEQAEKALNKYSTIKTRFLKNISHEARVPLSSVLALTETLKDNWHAMNEDEKFETLGCIYQETNRLSKFILDTFDTSKFLEGQIKLNLTKGNFADFLHNTVNKYAHSFGDLPIKLKINHFDDYRCAFDNILLDRVIKNLIMNAIRFSAQEKKLTISLYKTYLANSEIPAIQCSIKDEGIGIPENEKESIFGAFTESSRTESQACGTGLGLSICKEIVEAHFGNIWVENNVISSGCTVSFTIPTNLFPLSADIESTNQTNAQDQSNILTRELSRVYQSSDKRPFALIGISPFNSYFSIEKILEICEWIHKHYDDFAIFIPDQISRYTFDALGYSESRIKEKVRKQDNYTTNKAKKALSYFYENYPEKQEVKIHTISQLTQQESYQQLYKIYSNLFLTDKDFRRNCLEVTEWVLMNNNKDKTQQIEESQKNIAAQYFLLELPVMRNATDVLQIEFCDFVYQSIPNFLKHLYLSQDLVSPNQNFLVLK